MEGDIVRRLRSGFDGAHPDYIAIVMLRAADEIERLRVEADRWKRSYQLTQGIGITVVQMPEPSDPADASV